MRTVSIRRYANLGLAAVLILVVVLVALPQVARAAAAGTTPLATANIDPTGSLEDFSPVRAIVEANGRWYIGGDFQTAAGETQPYLAAIEVSTGRLDQLWRPQPNREVRSLAVSPDGSSVYVGGKFNNISGVWISRIAKLDAVTGEVDVTFNPGANASVESIVTDGVSVWASGVFANIGGSTLDHIAKLDATTGVADPAWTTEADGNVFDLELDGATLYAAGSFEELGGEDRDRIGSMDAATGTVNTFSPDAPFKVYDIALHPDGTKLYAATAGSLSQGGNALTAFDTTTAAELWRRTSSGDFQAVVATTDLVYGGTHGDYIFISNDGPFFEEDNPNAIPRSKLAAFDPITGDLDSWDPGADSVSGVWELAVGPSGLLVGGDFLTIGDETQSHFAVLPGGGSGNLAPEPRFTHSCSSTSCSFDASGSTDADGSLVGFDWDFGDGQTATGSTPNVSLTNYALHMVRLTVTDDTGNSANTINQVSVGDGGLDVHAVGASNANASEISFTVAFPTDAETNDVAIAFLTVNDVTAAVTAPTGWTLAGEQVVGTMRSQVWNHTLAAGDAGTDVTFVLDRTSKGDLTISTFRYVDPTLPIASIASDIETASWGEHSAPTATSAMPSSFLHFWADRTLDTSMISAPGTSVLLSAETGVGAAHISSALSLASQVGGGTVPSTVAISNTQSMNAIGWTLALTRDDFANGPASCTASVDDGTVTLDWTRQRRVQNYVVRRNGSWLAGAGDVLTWTDSPGVGSHDYLIRTVIEGVTIDTSCTPTIVIEEIAQVCTATDNGDGSITLDWTSIAGENKYTVRRNGAWLTSAGDTLTWNDTPGFGTFTYIIRSKKSGVVTNTTCNPTITLVAAAQTCTATENGDGSTTLDWTEIVGENKYIVRRNDSWLDDVVGGLTYTDVTATPGDTYVIRSKLGGVTTNTDCQPA